MGLPYSYLLIGPEKGLLWESWGEDCSVFCKDTGETHHLSMLPAEVLKRICAAPITLDDLARSFAAECALEDDVDWRSKVAAIVSDLLRLELVRTPP